MNNHVNSKLSCLFQTIDRGSRGITTVLSAVVFNIAPTLFELGLVSAVLAATCGPQFRVAIQHDNIPQEFLAAKLKVSNL